MSRIDKKTEGAAVADDVKKTVTEAETTVEETNPDVEIERLTDKWKRALADSENARKRADASLAEGKKHGIAAAVKALAPVFDALSLGIEAAQKSPDADDPRIAAHLEGLRNARTAFETGLKALGVRTIAPENTPFDPALHEAVHMKETDEAKSGQVLVLHRPGFAVGQRLIRPARVTVSAAPSPSEEE
jgi:molecular chaperone GrpE